jgi:hypothetical protein
VFDAIAREPGTYIAYDHGQMSWGFSLDAWQAYYAAQSSSSYKFNGISNPSVEEQQKQLAAILLGSAKCDGQGSSEILGCIQDAYDTMGDSNTLVGGNYNFSYLNVTIQGTPFDPGSLGCFMRCGSIDSLHFHDRSDGTFHVDTANPWGIPVVGAIIHLTFDYIGGNTWWSAGIPRPWWH